MQAGIARGDERGERVVAHESDQLRALFDAEMGRNVKRHLEILLSNASSCSAVPTLSHGPR